MIERNVLIVDCETTGLTPNDRVVEVAGILMEGPRIVKVYSTLVNPSIEIPCMASAIHHICDHHVKDAPHIDAALQPLLAENFEYVVAHNAQFDRVHLDLGDVSWLCTWKLANVVWPEAPSYSNQALRYWLGIPDPTHGIIPHRALYDAEITANIFAKILERSTKEDPYPGMFAVSNEPVKLRKVTFGEHNGKLWQNVPLSYLDWMVTKSNWDENVIYTARYWRNRKLNDNNVDYGDSASSQQEPAGVGAG
jgi:exodeoxyribonuclease X